MDGRIVFQIISFIVAITFHEAAHAWVAFRCGDRTAEAEGRLSLNPLDHVDPFGTVILPIMLLSIGAPVFGWAKPVPVDTRNLNDPKTDEYWISLAGPLSNFILAAISAGFIRLIIAQGDFLVAPLGRESVFMMVNFFMTMVLVNLVLCIFNLIPIPPLDGFHIVRSMLPDDLYESLDVPAGVGFIFFIILMQTGITDKVIQTFLSPAFELLTGITFR